MRDNENSIVRILVFAVGILAGIGGFAFGHVTGDGHKLTVQRVQQLESSYQEIKRELKSMSEDIQTLTISVRSLGRELDEKGVRR